MNVSSKEMQVNKGNFM